MSLAATEQMFLVVVTLIGMALCSAGAGRAAARGTWRHPFAIFAALLGVLALGIVAAALLGINLPLISSPLTAAAVIAALVVVKVGITQLHRLRA